MKRIKNKELKKLNKQLIKALYFLFNAHTNNGGTTDYPEKDYSWISDDLDYIEVKYLGNKPDGTMQERFARDGEPMLTDEQAYELLACRLNNTRIIACEAAEQEEKYAPIEGEKFARKCDITGEGMNEGYLFGDEKYIKYKKDAEAYAKSLGYETLEDAFEGDDGENESEQETYYFTAWEDEEDFQYIFTGGKLVEIE